MNVLPVITRELRAQARQPFTFTLRVFGVGAMLAAASLFALQYSAGPDLGAVLFRYLHLTLFGAIWILVPFSAADCISRERREGTLGLLFLTPLKPADIVVAKSIAHGLRAGTLLLAILPVLTISFLLGGVSWQQVSVSALTNFSAVCWALAAALVASAITRSSLRATVGAVSFSLCGLFLSVTLLGWFAVQAMGRSPMKQGSLLDMSLEAGFELGLKLVGVSGGFPLASPRGFWAVMFQATSAATLVAVLMLALAVVVASWRIRRNWREEPPPIWMQRVNAFFCTPMFWLKFFKRWMRWKIERNPIGWLEQRTWTGRLVTWAWFAIVVSIYSAVLVDRNFFRNSHGMQMTLAWLIMISMAASAAGSFRRERESGVMELLLVTPLSTRQIIGGRLRGLWGQFLPAVSILLGIWVYFDQLLNEREGREMPLMFAGLFFSVPAIGLYFSLRCRHFVAAFLLTLVSSLVPGWVLGLGLGAFGAALGYAPGTSSGELLVKLAVVQGGLMAACLFGLKRRLEKRLFPFERMAA